MPVIQAAGIPGYVRGHVGHSVGLNREVEEWPVIGAASDIAFSDGMVFSVETPYYGHGVGSILLEDMVELTSEGITTLTTESKDLIQL
jgi:Xaa-Pro aminopeptidase